DGVGAAVVVVGAVAKDIRVVVGVTVVEASVDSATVVGATSVARDAENTGKVVGFTSAVIGASVVKDGAVAEAAFVAVEGAVVLGEDMSMVVGVKSMVVEAAVSVATGDDTAV
ncbi:hypothetical protein M9458_001280, partial [Cirrhinus mrigala]